SDKKYLYFFIDIITRERITKINTLDLSEIIIENSDTVSLTKALYQKYLIETDYATAQRMLNLSLKAITPEILTKQQASKNTELLPTLTILYIQAKDLMQPDFKMDQLWCTLETLFDEADPKYLTEELFFPLYLKQDIDMTRFIVLLNFIGGSKNIEQEESG